jgi:hypothetical protein
MSPHGPAQSPPPPRQEVWSNCFGVGPGILLVGQFSPSVVTDSWSSMRPRSDGSRDSRPSQPSTFAGARSQQNWTEVWPDAATPMLSAWRSRAPGRSRPSWSRSARAASRASSASRRQAAEPRAGSRASVGGLAALVDRSISAADAIGKTADKIGVGVEALQELRFAAKASGVEQQTLDMALQRFTRRAAEAAQGTGEAKDALAQMGIALRDQSGNLRRSEDLLGDVADASARIEDPAERVRLAFKLFDSEGVALVNLLSDGSGALEQMRERARDLGIVLDEHLVRDAERARTELDTLSQVISANLTRAALEAAPVIADLSSWLADVAGTLFNITHEGSERIIAEHERRIAQIEALRAKDGSNAQQVDQLIAQSAGQGLRLPVQGLDRLQGQASPPGSRTSPTRSLC